MAEYQAGKQYKVNDPSVVERAGLDPVPRGYIFTCSHVDPSGDCWAEGFIFLGYEGEWCVAPSSDLEDNLIELVE